MDKKWTRFNSPTKRNGSRRGNLRMTGSGRRRKFGTDDEIDSDIEAASDGSVDEAAERHVELQDRTERDLIELKEALSSTRNRRVYRPSASAGDRDQLSGRHEEKRCTLSPLAENSRLSLAKRYLAALGIGQAVEGDFGAVVDSEGSGKRRKTRAEDSTGLALPAEGRTPVTFRATPCDSSRLAFDQSDRSVPARFVFAQGHKRPITCLDASGTNEEAVVTGGKDCAVLLWDINTMTKLVFAGGRKQFFCGGHFEEVLDVCFLENSRDIFCSVGGDRLVRVWDKRHPQRCQASMKGHKAPVSCVRAEPTAGIIASQTEWYSEERCFEDDDADDSDDGQERGGEKGNDRGQSLNLPGGLHRLYTGSWDKTVKVWDLRMLRCLDTHYGHINRVTSIDILHPDRPLTGAEDGTLRIWKIENETHLAFATASRFVDACAYLSPRLFLSGSQDGFVCAWASNQRKFVAGAYHRSSVNHKVSQAGHPEDNPKGRSDATPVGNQPSAAVTSLVTIPYSDVFFSGGEDGCIVAWRLLNSRQSDGGPTTTLGRIGCFDAAAAVLSPAKSSKGISSSVDNAIGGSGIVSAMSLTKSKRFLLATVSKESKRGRHYTTSKARNGLLVLPLADMGKE